MSDAALDGCVSRASLWRPDSLRTSAWLEHAPFAFWLTETLEPTRFVELGTHTGFSYLCFCQAVARLGLPTTGYGVDTWKGDEQTGFYGKEVLQELTEYHDARYSAFSRLVRSAFDDALPHFDEGSIDLLHLDGLHTYAAVRHDFDAWRPKLSDRSVVLLHDTNVREDDFGVHRLWRELCSQYPGFEFSHGHGLGVLGVGSEAPSLLASLFESAEDPGRVASVRAAYARLGGAVRLEYELTEARSLLQVENRERALSDDLLAERTAEIRELEAKLSALEQSVEGYETRLPRLEAALPELEAARARLEAEHTELEAEHTELEAEHTELEAALEARGSELELRTAEAAASRIHADALHHQLLLLLTSTSWRLTEPLRALGRGARHLMPRRATAARFSRRLRRPDATRTRELEPIRSPAPAGARPRVVFLSGEPDTPGHSYRVTNLASTLAPRFFDTRVLRLDELERRADELDGAAVLWIWRAPYSREVASAIEAARAGGAVVVFDVDDLMFRPDLARADVIDGIRTHGFSERDVRRLYKSLQQTLLASDQCTAPTAPLTREMRAFGKPTVVVPNGFDSALLRAARAARGERIAAGDDGLVRIGYAAGSFTHQRDMAVAASAVGRVLAEHPDARFVSFEGALDIAELPDLERVRPQVELRQLVSLDRLPAEYARFDVNIAPLEVGNPFCEVKSELKYFEAALAGTPTVASPTEPFAAVVRHGETGYLAADEESWYEHLSLLVGDPGTRRRVADAAYLDALWRFGPERRGVAVNRLVSSLIATAPVSADLHRAAVSESVGSAPPVEVAEHDVVYESGRASASRVAVVVSVFDYGHLVEEALESVRAQTIRGLDLVVVDDCSTDDSVEVVRRWLERRGDVFNRAVFLRHRRNSGLARTRNAGVLVADTELFLPLDPDNVLLPNCVESALSVLDETGAAFAFPTLELFGSASGTIPSSDWDPMLLRGANYIDAMALVRRACWLVVGGYSRLDVDGWEDYDLWCKFVERGFFGVRVPEVSARYRVHRSSMLSTTTDVPEQKARLLEQVSSRHPWLDIALTAGRDGQAPALLRAETEVEVHGVPAREAPEARFRDLLRCPETGEELDWSRSESQVVSRESGVVWPIVEGRPVFTEAGPGVRRHPEEHLSNLVPDEARRLFDTANGPVLNLSAGGTQTRHPNVLEAEYAIFRHTDVVVDAHRLPLADDAFAAVVCLNAFEHYRDPRRVADEIWRVLEPGGRLFLRTAFLQPLHEEPFHFFNCTKYGLQLWLERFELEDLRVSDNFNPVYALSWLASDLQGGFAELSREQARLFGELRLAELAEFWQRRETPDARLSALFSDLPTATQERTAAGWQATARKPR